MSWFVRHSPTGDTGADAAAVDVNSPDAGRRYRPGVCHAP